MTSSILSHLHFEYIANFIYYVSRLKSFKQENERKSKKVKENVERDWTI